MKWDSEKLATWGLAALLAYAAVACTFRAASKPFWFDELCTLTVAQQPSISAMLDVLRHAADSHPLPFYLVERISGAILPNEHIAFRAPSILAFCCVILCTFLFVRKRTCGKYALLCATIPFISLLYDPYAVEARGYILMTACVAVAMVSYQNADRLRWVILLGLSLVCAALFHHYAVFVLAPFALAEGALTWKIQRLRWGVWIALACGLVPLILFRSFLSILKQYYGAHYWVQPSLVGLAGIHGSLFHLTARWGVAILAVSVAGMLDSLRPKKPEQSDRTPPVETFLHEKVLALGFIVLPFLFFLAMKVVHGGVLDRYVLPSVLGFAVAVGYMLPRFDRGSAKLFGIFCLSVLAMQEGGFWMAHRHTLGRTDSPVASIEKLVNTAGHPELRVVVSHGQDYFEIVHYLPAERASRFVGLVDLPASMTYAGSDFLDKNLLALQPFTALHIYRFQDFAPKHPEFLLYSGGGDYWDWWPDRLLHDGYSLKLLAKDGVQRVYLADAETSAQ
jgi:hypothetical protein